jgi:hypothetical protein
MRTLIMQFWWLAAMGTLLTSCATTQLTTVWKDDAYQGQPHKVLVIAALENPSVKRVMETAFVQQMNRLGLDAVSGFSVLSDAEEKNREVLVEKVRQLGIDTVLVAKFLDKQTITTYVPGSAAYGSPYAGGWQGYYSYSPGYYVQDQYAILVTNLYDVKSEKLVWTATSETNITGGDEQTVQSFARTILDKLTQQKVLPAPSSSKTK